MKKIRNIVVVLGVIGVSSIVGVSSAQASQSATAHTVYSCPTGGSLDGTNCVIPGTVIPSYTTSTPANSARANCPTFMQGNYCYTGTGFWCDNYWCIPPITYSCTEGILSGSDCLVTIPAVTSPDTTYQATSITTYSCPDGYVLVVHTCKSPQEGAVVDPTDLFTTIKDFITTKVLPASAILFVIGVTIRVAFSRVKKYAK